MGCEKTNDACDAMVEAITNAAAEGAAKIVMKRIDERLLDLRNEESAADPVQDTREQMLRIELDAACATIESLRKREAELVKNHDAEIRNVYESNIKRLLLISELAENVVKRVFRITPVEIEFGQRKAWPLGLDLIRDLRKLQQMAGD